MKRVRVRESSDNNGDDGLLSQLPENVIHDILTKLPIKDAARTAILSSKWRRHWRSIPQLVFDDRFSAGRGIAEPNKLIMNIYKSLLAHDGAPVTKFVLAVPGLTPRIEIDHIILHLSGRGVQDFTLEISREANNIDNVYKLPSSLFTALQLSRLTLRGHCSFTTTPPSWFAGFSKLKSLELSEVRVPSYDFFERFLPKCPLLQELRLSHCRGATKLELDAPRLRVFFFEGWHFQKISFKHTPILSDLTLTAYGLQISDLVLAPSTPLRGLQTLVVTGLVCGRLQTVRLLVCLIITSSPILHTLTIEFDDTIQLNWRENNNAVTSIGSMFARLSGRGTCVDSALQHFQVFEIKNSRQTQVELELVRFVLATAPLLRRIRITPHPKQQLDARKVIRFMKEVMQCRRISKEATVIYDSKDDLDLTPF